VAQLVEACVDAFADHPAVAQRERRLGDEGALDARAQLGQIVERSGEALEARCRYVG
jgi:hypothetical protein